MSLKAARHPGTAQLNDLRHDLICNFGKRLLMKQEPRCSRIRDRAPFCGVSEVENFTATSRHHVLPGAGHIITTRDVETRAFFWGNPRRQAGGGRGVIARMAARMVLKCTRDRSKMGDRRMPLLGDYHADLLHYIRGRVMITSHRTRCHEQVIR